jgi:hypothetical protein
MRDEDLKALATGVGWLRIGIGSLAIVAPGLAMRLWLSADGRSDQVKAMGLAVGARDVVLGLGTLRALRGDGNPALWLKYGAIADAADGIGTIRTFRREPSNPRMLTALMAVSFSAIGWVLSRQDGLVRTGA